MNNEIIVSLVDENDVEIQRVGTTFEIIGEAGVIEYRGEFFTYRSQRGQFFTTPVFQRVKKVKL